MAKVFIQFSEKYQIEDPLTVMGEKDFLWKERLAEMQKTNPSMTFQKMNWCVADLPDVCLKLK